MTNDARDDLAIVRSLRADVDQLKAENEALKGGRGGGTSGGMESVDAKIAAAEARTDTKFAELRGDLKDFATKGTVWAAVGTALGIVLAVAAFAGDRFDSGLSFRAAIDGALSEQRKRDDVQDQKMDGQDKKLDEILRRLPPDRPAKK